MNFMICLFYLINRVTNSVMILSLFMLIVFQNICLSHEQIPILLADGGYLNFNLIPDTDPKQELIFALHGKYMVEGMKVGGSVSHPYGEGPFELVYNPIIENASITTPIVLHPVSFITGWDLY